MNTDANPPVNSDVNGPEPPRDEIDLAEWLGPAEASALDPADQADLEVAVEAALAGGREVMRRYEPGESMAVTEKSPGNPVTEADRASDRAITGVLEARRPGEPVLSEEGSRPEGLERAGGGAGEGASGHLWVVDPLDGTKEFLAGNGEFAVMVGLAVEGRARLGVVYRPDPGVLYLGTSAGGAWRAELLPAARRRQRRERESAGGDEGDEGEREVPPAVDERMRSTLERGESRPGRGTDRPAARRGEGADAEDPASGEDAGEGDEDTAREGPEVTSLADFGPPTGFSVDAPREGPIRVLHSRSHTPEGLDRLRDALGEVELLPHGSAGLKGARVASDRGDLYVHPVPYMMEWDTCAPEAVLRGAGARVGDCRGEELRYGKPDPSQPHGLFAARPEVWDRVADVVRELAPRGEGD